MYAPLQLNQEHFLLLCLSTQTVMYCIHQGCSFVVTWLRDHTQLQHHHQVCWHYTTAETWQLDPRTTAFISKSAKLWTTGRNSENGHASILIKGITLERKRFFGVNICEGLTWTHHTDTIIKTAWRFNMDSSKLCIFTNESKLTSSTTVSYVCPVPTLRLTGGCENGTANHQLGCYHWRTSTLINVGRKPTGSLETPTTTDCALWQMVLQHPVSQRRTQTAGKLNPAEMRLWNFWAPHLTESLSLRTRYWLFKTC